MLDGRATAAWRQSSEVREAVSSRIVITRLKRVSQGQRKSGAPGKIKIRL